MFKDQSALLYRPAGGILAILTVSGPQSARCQSNFEKKIVFIRIIFSLFRFLIAKILFICIVGVTIVPEYGITPKTTNSNYESQNTI